MHTVNLDTPGGYDKDGKDYTAGERAAKKATAAHEDAPTSRGMVVFSVLFYLVAALVMVSICRAGLSKRATCHQRHQFAQLTPRPRCLPPQIMANKWVLNSVPVPLFFLFVQLTIAVVLLHLSAVFGESHLLLAQVFFSTCQVTSPYVPRTAHLPYPSLQSANHSQAISLFHPSICKPAKLYSPSLE